MTKSKSPRSDAATSAPAVPSNRPAPPTDVQRERIETVVVVFILVNVLRMFGAEAFVIPTGSMATTLLGAHKTLTCPKCGHVNSVNASDQAEGRNGGAPVVQGQCHNCRQPVDLEGEGIGGGDRVLVAKFLYEGFFHPERWQVVVFKCPQVLKARINYIKRLVGLPGETLQVRYGDVAVKPPGEGQEFTLARKPPSIIMATRVLVFDNDQVPLDETVPRWAPTQTANWEISSNRRSFFATADASATLSYRHLVRNSFSPAPIPQVVTDFQGYNTNETRPADHWELDGNLSNNWVGDLIVEATIALTQRKGMVTAELREGTRRYLCHLDFSAGTAKLVQQPGDRLLQEIPLPADLETRFPFRFANVDDQLTAWVNGKLLFPSPVMLAPMRDDEAGPTPADLEPIHLHTDGVATTFSDLKVYRDVYYSQVPGQPDYMDRSLAGPHTPAVLAYWRDSLLDRSARLFPVDESSYFMMGDNSMRSSDSRDWGSVARHLLLGRALAVYLPLARWRFVH